MRKTVIRLIVSLALCTSILACGSAGTASGKAEDEQQTSCKPGIVDSIAFTDNATASSPLSPFWVLRSPTQCQTLYASAWDSCGQKVGPVTPSSWSANSNLAYIESNTGSSAVVCFHKGPSAAFGSSGLVWAFVDGSMHSVALDLTWEPTSIANLQRWYRADSFMPLADQLVGVSGTSPWLDLSGGSSPYNSSALAGRMPMFTTELGFPALRLCGVNSTATCPGVTTNQHMRIAPSFAAFSLIDLTVIYVAARANANANYLLVNQSIGNNTGVFLGWMSDTEFRFGLNGPGGTPRISATIPAYSGTASAEIWTARLNTGSDVDNMGLTLFRNGTVVASDTTVTTKSPTATTIPYIGTQRSDQNNAKFYVSEVLVYWRALSSAELTRLHQYLQAKYNISSAP